MVQKHRTKTVQSLKCIACTVQLYQWHNLLKYLQFHYHHHKHLLSDLPPDTQNQLTLLQRYGIWTRMQQNTTTHKKLYKSIYTTHKSLLV